MGNKPCRLFMFLAERFVQASLNNLSNGNDNVIFGSMPQGSLLGPMSFLVAIDNLVLGCPTPRYVDDTTMS